MEGGEKVKFRDWLFVKGWIVILPIIILFIAIWIWPNLNVPPLATIDPQGNIHNNTQTLYLLSSIAQSLAAILALVFTLSLIVSQLNSRYSPRTYRNFFNVFTIIYIVVFVISVFFPLWVIQNFNWVEVKVSLSLSAIC